MEEALLDNLKELQEKCEEKHINYGLFICDRPHSVTGAANFTLEEISIMIENIARSLPFVISCQRKTTRKKQSRS